MALKDENKKYIVRVANNNQDYVPAYEQWMDDIEKNDNVELLYQNETGFVAKINRGEE